MCTGEVSLGFFLLVLCLLEPGFDGLRPLLAIEDVIFEVTFRETLPDEEEFYCC